MSAFDLAGEDVLGRLASMLIPDGRVTVRVERTHGRREAERPRYDPNQRQIVVPDMLVYAGADRVEDVMALFAHEAGHALVDARDPYSRYPNPDRDQALVYYVASLIDDFRVDAEVARAWPGAGRLIGRLRHRLAIATGPDTDPLDQVVAVWRERIHGYSILGDDRLLASVADAWPAVEDVWPAVRDAVTYGDVLAAAADLIAALGLEDDEGQSLEHARAFHDAALDDLASTIASETCTALRAAGIVPWSSSARTPFYLTQAGIMMGTQLPRGAASITVLTGKAQVRLRGLVAKLRAPTPGPTRRQTAGRFDPRLCVRAAIGDPAVFSRLRLNDAPSSAWYILVDQSQSMSNAPDGKTIPRSCYAAAAVTAFALSLRECGVPVAVSGFCSADARNTVSAPGGAASELTTQVNELLRFDEAVDDTTIHQRLADLARVGNGNDDAAAIRAVTPILSERTERFRFLVVVSDVAPVNHVSPAYWNAYADPSVPVAERSHHVLRSEVLSVAGRGIIPVSIAFDSPHAVNVYPNNIQLEDLHQLGDALSALAETALIGDRK